MDCVSVGQRSNLPKDLLLSKSQAASLLNCCGVDTDSVAAAAAMPASPDFLH